jgi:two-component system nitrogen regulation sensor histidine kinase NtrY
VTSPPVPRPADGPSAPRGRLRWLRVSKFERSIALALVVAVTLPLGGALWLAADLAEQNLELGFNPRMVERIEAVPALYGELFQARKQLYQAQARAIVRDLPRDRKAWPGFLAAALEHTPRLRRISVVGEDGTVLAEQETAEPNPEGEWRPAPVRLPLRDGSTLVATFAIEAVFFVELAEAADLGNLVRTVDALGAEVRRAHVRAFAYALAVFAIAAAVVGIALARMTTRRVSALVDGVHRLAAGDLTVQVSPGRSRDEVADLTREFNRMVREVRESRDRIVYLEKISGWQEVARRLAHEIKNPLTPIQLAFQQLEARWRDAPGGDDAFGRLLGEAGEIVRDEIGTLQRLVEEFSGFAKLPDVRPGPADLAEIVDEFVRTSPQVTDAADVEVVRAAGDVPVAVDRALMRRVLSNLAANAVDAARPARARIHLGIARARDRAVLTFADEGPGVGPEVRDRIFDPYFTTKKDGTGLGLAIVKKIVLQHGGEIQAGERPGGGASFTIALPIREGVD